MRRSARIAIMTATIAIAAATAARGQDELLAEGRRAYERGEYTLARETLWKYLDATANLTGAQRMPQAEALYYIAVMEPDANVANRHYEIIVDEFPAATVADQALYRLGLFELSTGRPADARGRFERLQREYPFSRAQPELPLLIGRTHMAEGNPTEAIASFEDGFRRIKAQDLPREMPRGQREAMEAEYAHWLANAHMDAGDEQAAIQYYSLLTLDYPASPQASEARATLASLQGGGEGEEGVPREGVIGDVAVTDPAEDAPMGGPEEQIEVPARVEPEPEAPAAQAPDIPEIPAPIPQDPGQAAPDRPAAEEELEQQAPAEEPVAEEAPAEEQPQQIEPDREPDPTPPRRAEPPAEEPEAAEPAFEPPPSDGLPPAKFPPADAGDLVYLQVGAFNSASRAADLSKRLKAEGFASTIQVAVIEGRGFYRVRVGPFRPETDAEQMDEDKEKLTTLGYPAEPVKAE